MLDRLGRHSRSRLAAGEEAKVNIDYAEHMMKSKDFTFAKEAEDAIKVMIGIFARSAMAIKRIDLR